MLALFVRAGAAMIPGASRLPFIGGGGDSIPDLELSLGPVAVDRDRLVAYDRVCGFSVGDALPATYPHMLAFPLHLALMTDSSFPFPAIGLVHVANRIRVLRPIRVTEELTMRVWPGELQPHPRGQQFSVFSEAKVGDELVWEEESVNLRRGGSAGSEGGGGSSGSEGPGGSGGSGGSSGSEGGGGSSGSNGGAAAGRSPNEPLPATATWRLPGDLGRRYASVSGDFNPIHIHPLTARLFGFPTAIAHGMWTKARSLAALEGTLPAAYTVEVSFRRPILLPATVEFAEAAVDGGLRFGVRDAKKGKPHLDGSVTFG
jgi:acyl dehydratase